MPDVVHSMEDDLLTVRKACLQSLGFETESLRKDEISILDGTCEWLIKHPIFDSWHRQPNSLLWIRGKPGAGKSAVMKFAVLQAEKRKTREEEILASFFFHGRGSELVKTPVGL